MNCIPDGALRASLDGELAGEEQAAVAAHLAVCASCRERQELLAARSAAVSEALGTLAPGASDLPEAAAQYAWARYRQRTAREVRRVPWHRMFRPAWSLAAAAVCVALLASFPAGRSFAQRILAMLRVRQVSVVSIDPAAVQPFDEKRMAEIVGRMISEDVVVTLEPGPPVALGSAEEAGRAAGFAVRVPATPPAKLWYMGPRAFHMNVKLERLRAVLDEIGRPDLRFPASLDGATIAAHIPGAVAAMYGECPQPGQRSPEARRLAMSTCTEFVQIPSPTVSTPPELNLSEIAEVALQAAGMSAADAHAFCSTVDWTSTMVLPVPRLISRSETVEVDGSSATLVRYQPGERGPGRYMLVWVKNGMIYTVAGPGDPASGIALAQSLP